MHKSRVKRIILVFIRQAIRFKYNYICKGLIKKV